MELKIGAAYVRVSTAGQEEYSPDSQLKLIRDYAKKAGYIIPDEYVYQDDGISGKSADKRPAFRLMVAQAKEKNPPFSAVFVWKYSRFARNAEEALVYKNLLRKNGVDVISISEPQNDSPFSSLIERIIEWMDEYYLIRLSDEVRRGMKEKASRGEATGKPPFGYDVENKVLVPNENAEYVRYIFDAYIGGKSFREIAFTLGNSGVKINGDSPSHQTIRYILQNPAYCGKIRWEDEEHAAYRGNDYKPNLSTLTDGKHEPIISVEDFVKAQERINKRRSEPRYVREGHPVMMLKGLLRCDSCGGTLVDTTGRKGKNAKPRLQCCRYSQGKCHVSHYIAEEDANAYVIESLEQMLAAKSFVFSDTQTREPKITRDWDKLIAQEEARLKRAKTALLDGAFTNAEYKDVKAAVEDNISKLQAAKAKEAVSEVDLDKFAEKVSGVLQVIKQPDVSGERKNMALRSIVDKIVFVKHSRTFVIYFAP